MKIPVSKDKSNLGLRQFRKLTFADILEELDDYIEPHHLPKIKEIEEAHKRRKENESKK